MILLMPKNFSLEINFSIFISDQKILFANDSLHCTMLHTFRSIADCSTYLQHVVSMCTIHTKTSFSVLFLRHTYIHIFVMCYFQYKMRNKPSVQQAVHPLLHSFNSTEDCSTRLQYSMWFLCVLLAVFWIPCLPDDSRACNVLIGREVCSNFGHPALTLASKKYKFLWVEKIVLQQFLMDCQFKNVFSFRIVIYLFRSKQHLQSASTQNDEVRAECRKLGHTTLTRSQR